MGHEYTYHSLPKVIRFSDSEKRAILRALGYIVKYVQVSYAQNEYHNDVTMYTQHIWKIFVPPGHVQVTKINGQDISTHLPNRENAIVDNAIDIMMGEIIKSFFIDQLLKSVSDTNLTPYMEHEDEINAKKDQK